VSYEAHLRAARAAQLDILGGFHPGPADRAPEGCETLLLLGPYEPGFWARFVAAPEYRDGAANPLDRWSKRIIGDLAKFWQGHAIFPSDGPPYPPFGPWAQATGCAWQSPVGLLVHERAGLMMSFRGAVALRSKVALPAPGACPCDTCSQPCRRACPVAALTPAGYDVAACKTYLRSANGADCMTQGCAVRRACPVSASYGRLPQQSAFHMVAFLHNDPTPDPDPTR